MKILFIDDSSADHSSACVPLRTPGGIPLFDSREATE